MDLTGKKIRNIDVRSIIGQGGVGVVYLGFDEVLQRNVALKVLRSSRVDEANKLRFLREARVLSQLDHPLICRIYDSLEIEGQLVLLLEYVEGVSLAQAMIDGLGERKKFEIAGQLTQALSAAHGHGIIHRDLKPENVIVKADGKIKVLDFGLARLLAEDTEEVLEKPKNRSPEFKASITSVDDDSATGVNTQASTDAITEFGNVMGTVAYMSPEQAVGETLTTASDMYSLGIILHQLFTGVKAYESDLSLIQKLQKVAAAETLPVVHPDGALGELITRLEEFEPAVRPRAVDVLDRLMWIRRRPLRRRRRYLITAVVLALIAVGAKYTIDLRHEQNLTVQALEEAQRAREEATQVSDFLISVFRVSEPGEERGNEVTAREILDRGAKRLDVELADQPIVWARLMAKIGKVYDLLGLHREAITVFEKVVAEQRRLYPEGNVDLAESLHSLGLAHYMVDAYDESEALFEESLAMHRALVPPDQPAIASVLEHLGQILYDRGQLDDAQELIEQSIEIRQAELKSDDPQIAAGLWALGQVLNDRSEYVRAEALYTQSLEIFEKAGGQEPSVASVLEALGVLMLNQGRHHDAESMFRRSLEIRKRVLGPGHQNLAISASYLAAVTSIEGRYEEAERLLRDALAIFEEKLGPNHFNVAANLTMIGDVLIDTGRYQEAGEVFNRALDILEASDLSDNFNALVARHGCGEVAQRLRHWAEAETFFLETLNGWERTTGLDSIQGVDTTLCLCRVLDAQGFEARSTECWARVLDLAQELAEKEPDNSETQLVCAEVKNSWGVRLAKRGDRQSARSEWTTAREIVERLSGRDSEVRMIAMSAEILFRLGENKEAEVLYDRLQATGWSDPVLDELATNSRGR